MSLLLRILLTLGLLYSVVSLNLIHRPEEENAIDRRMSGGVDDQNSIQFQSHDDLETQWKDFKVEHEKKYTNSKEDEDRKQIFQDNLEGIAVHNQRYVQGVETYEQGMNQFGDLTHSEFVKYTSCRNTGNVTMEELDKSIRIPDELLEERVLPSAIDWRPTGAVTRVKNQGDCGSCWAFGAVGALEGQTFLKSKGPMVPLSEQNLVDCSSHNNGCGGGFASKAYLDIFLQGGIDTEDSYQYEAEQGRCRYNPRLRGATVSGFVVLPRKREDFLRRAIASIGPIGVAIDASDLQFYRSGIYSSSTCDDGYWSLNHEVLAVGYKSASPGRDYWIVKNSWSSKWGMDGYVLMSRNKNNQCGIATDATYPIV